MDIKGSTGDRYTGLILLSGIDNPGILSALFATLEPFSITILDIEQIINRSRLILTVLIELDPAHSGAIESDLDECARTLGVDMAISFSHQSTESITHKSGLITVIACAAQISPGAIAAIASNIANAGGNIERIHRSTSEPFVTIEFAVSGSNNETLLKAFGSTKEKHELEITIG
ncbi:MAG: ACT domain-containing protein [Candidatus Planktophila sp.]